jgi:phospholipid N-methyltransferase
LLVLTIIHVYFLFSDTQYDIIELGAGTGLFTRKIMEKLKDMPVKFPFLSFIEISQ